MLIEGQSIDNSTVNTNPVVSDPAPVDSGTTPIGDPTLGMENPLFKLLGADGNINPVEPAAQVNNEPVVNPNPDPAPGPQDLVIPDKFRNPDGSVNTNALIKSYNNLEGKLGEQGNQLGQMQELQRKIEELNTRFEAKQEPAAHEPQPQQWTGEQVQEMNEQFLQEFYENPLQSLGKLVNVLSQQQARSIVDPVIKQFEPILSEREQNRQIAAWDSQVQEVAQTNHEEFARLKDTMKDVIATQADILNALPDTVNKAQYVFNQAKAMDVEKNKPKSPEELLGDPEFQQKIMQNDAIKNMILKSHVEAVKSGQPPVVIGNMGGQPPAAPTSEIQSTSDATKAAKGYFARLLGGGGL